MVVLSVDFSWYPMGTGSFFHSFFSTICYRLENQKWGRLYPCLMNELYQGKLEAKRIPEARKELRDVQNRLKEFAPTDIIWDIENLSMKPPWGDETVEGVTSLSNYFVTYDGRDMISLIFNAFAEAEEKNVAIFVESVNVVTL